MYAAFLQGGLTASYSCQAMVLNSQCSCTLVLNVVGLLCPNPSQKDSGAALPRSGGPLTPVASAPPPIFGTAQCQDSIVIWLTRSPEAFFLQWCGEINTISQWKKYSTRVGSELMPWLDVRPGPGLDAHAMRLSTKLAQYHSRWRDLRVGSSSSVLKG